MWESRVLQRAFERLELHEGKLSRAVLRGGGGGDVTSLPDPWGSNPLGPPGLFPSSLLFSLLPVAGRVVVADHTPGTLEKQGFRDQRATE